MLLQIFTQLREICVKQRGDGSAADDVDIVMKDGDIQRVIQLLYMIDGGIVGGCPMKRLVFWFFYILRRTANTADGKHLPAVLFVDHKRMLQIGHKQIVLCGGKSPLCLAQFRTQSGDGTSGRFGMHKEDDVTSFGPFGSGPLIEVFLQKTFWKSDTVEMQHLFQRGTSSHIGDISLYAVIGKHLFRSSAGGLLEFFETPIQFWARNFAIRFGRMQTCTGQKVKIGFINGVSRSLKKNSHKRHLYYLFSELGLI